MGRARLRKDPGGEGRSSLWWKELNEMHFPLLSSRVQAQYPLRSLREMVFREVESAGGARWRSTADAPALRRWVLLLEDLNDEELAALTDLFEASAGGWRTFLFVDPMGNLLRWSEDLRNSSWDKGAGVSITRVNEEEAEPAEFAIVNGGGVPAGISQNLPLPPGLRLCFACEMLGGRLKLRAGGAEAACEAATGWTRRYVVGESSGSVSHVELELGPGEAVHVRCLQAEAQMAPSAYMGTYETGGIYPKTRFAANGLWIRAKAPGRHSAEVRLESPVENGV